ncbi:MAG TPA: HTH domain-containing protein [Methanocorpusculum sp.]|nr:HTH domain-containing protein [Methanocorpusculum sp.]
MLSPSEEKVLELIAVNPTITGEKIAENLDVSLRHAKRLLAELKEKGAIQRIGSDKSGHWEIIINMPEQKH